MRISDWSSDVCSSDLDTFGHRISGRFRSMLSLSRTADGRAPAMSMTSNVAMMAMPPLCVFNQTGRIAYLCCRLHPAVPRSSTLDRKRVGEGQSVSDRVGPGGLRILKKQKKNK